MVNQDTINLIKKFEGCRLQAYIDPVGVWTIGYGHTAGVTPGLVITQKTADDILKEDLELFSANVKKVVTVPLNENQLGALTSFAYNVGIGNLKKSTLLILLNNADYKGAADEFKKWNKAGGKVLNGLVKRRDAERELFLKGTGMKVEQFSKKKDGEKLISPNFKVKEFACKDGSDDILIDTDFVRNVLQDIRNHFGKPLTINSAYRTVAYNKKVGGATNSYHTKGQAFDIVVKGYSPAEVAQYALSKKVNGIIKYNTFTHVDSRENVYHAINNGSSATPVSSFL